MNHSDEPLDEMTTRVRDLHRDKNGYCEECRTQRWPCRTIHALIGEWSFTIPEDATTDEKMVAVFQEQFRLHGVRAGDVLRINRE